MIEAAERKPFPAYRGGDVLTLSQPGGFLNEQTIDSTRLSQRVQSDYTMSVLYVTVVGFYPSPLHHNILSAAGLVCANSCAPCNGKTMGLTIGYQKVTTVLRSAI